MPLVRTARAEIYIQGNGQYTVMGWVREASDSFESLISSPGTNLTLAQAFTAAVNALTPLAVTGNGEKHAVIKLMTTVTG